MNVRVKWVIWIICLVSASSLGWLAHDPSTLPATSLGSISSFFVIAAALPTYLAFILVHPKRHLSLITSLSAFAMVVEWIGVHTGFPYGTFQYAASLKPVLIGGIPWTTSFGWAPLVLGTFVTGEALFRSKKSAVFSILSGLILLVAYDLVLDPGAVALGLWKYAEPSWYHAVPWTNFAGWLLTGGIATYILSLFTRRTDYINYFLLLIGPTTLLSFWIGTTLSSGKALPSLIGICLLVVFTTTWSKQSTKIN